MEYSIKTSVYPFAPYMDRKGYFANKAVINQHVNGWTPLRIDHV